MRKPSLDYVHPADVVALDEGATEEPLQSGGSPQDMVELLLRNARAVMHFVPHGGEQFRQLLAAVTVWQQRESGESIAVGTQTTEEGNGAEPPAAAQWVPPLDAEQWPGSVPTSGTFPDRDSPERDPFAPTDAGLLNALEEYEQQEQRAALGEATNAQPEVSQQPEELLRGDEEKLEHRRRRMHAAFSE